MNPPQSTRLNKLLALHLGVSRREADNLIAAGTITINQLPAVVGQQVTPSETVEINGRLVPQTTKFTYLAFHKPVGYVCSRHQQGETPTVYSLLPSQFHDLKLVGRLDRDSSGLILLTNDGDFAHSLTHPSFRKQKVYEIEINKLLTEEDFRKITKTGVEIGELKLSKFQLVASRQSSVTSKAATSTSDWRQETSHWRATLAEGRNRQIRRTFEALGYHVQKLHRINFGSFALDELKPQEYKEIFPN